VSVPINNLCKEDEIMFYVTDSGARVLLTDSDLRETAERAAPGSGAGVSVIRGEGADWIPGTGEAGSAPAGVEADDDALWARILLIPFRLKFTDTPTKANERKRQADLAEQLKLEAPGILAWLVRGAMQWYEGGLQIPKQVMAATDAYRRHEDIIGQFVDEACVVADNVEAQASLLYKAYVQWTTESNMHPLSRRNFGEQISRRFDKVRRKKGYYYQGVGLLADA
jgi:hypothetical protein